MTGIRILESKKVKPDYQTKYNLKRINTIKDKGVKINMLMRLIGRKNQQIKFLKGMINELKTHNKPLNSDPQGLKPSRAG